MKVVDLKPEVSEEMIEALERRLEQVRKGEIVGLALACEYRGGDTGYFALHANGSNLMTLIGAVEQMKYKILGRPQAQ